MQKRLFLAALILTASVKVFAQTPDIQNGDMEVWQSGKHLPKQWATFYTIDKEGIFSQSTEAHSGKYAIQVDFAPQKQFDNRRFFSLPAVFQTGKYRIKIHFKGAGDIRFISLNKQSTNASGKDSETNSVGAPAVGQIKEKEWKTYALDFNVINPGEHQLTICVNEADKLLIDDISIEKL